jgi:hypothetical protein
MRWSAITLWSTGAYQCCPCPRIGEREESLALAHNVFHPDPHGTARRPETFAFLGNG